MREITLTQGKVALVDDEDYERLSALPQMLALARQMGVQTK